MGLIVSNDTSDTITWQEVIENGYIVSNGKVYDVSNFTQHPGGSESLKRSKGTDATKSYNFHSLNGKRLWDTYYIGKLSSTNNLINEK